jgi:benzodiazapine receptor
MGRLMLVAALPAALGYGASLACRLPRGSSDGVPFRPPPWVFGAVWPVLYALLGLAWYATASSGGLWGWASLAYAATTALLTLWQVTYSCLRRTREAVFVLLASVLSTSYCVALSGRRERLMVIPLLVWTSFATLMNAWQTSLPETSPA